MPWVVLFTSNYREYNGLMEQGIIVFVDFDGVMHPSKGGDCFCRQPELAKILAALDDLSGVQTKMVVSSSWREGPMLRAKDGSFDQEQAAEFLGVEINRVLGATPIINHERRDLEIMSWLEASGRARSPWIAIDDDPLLFADDLVRSRTLFADPLTGLSSKGFAAAARCMASTQLGLDKAKQVWAELSCMQNQQASTVFEQAKGALILWLAQESRRRQSFRAHP